MKQNWISRSHDKVILVVLAVPRAAEDAVQGLCGGALKIRLHAPPVDGRANAALISFLSAKLNIPKRAVALKSGAGQRRKIITLSGVSDREVILRLLVGAALDAALSEITPLSVKGFRQAKPLPESKY